MSIWSRDIIACPGLDYCSLANARVDPGCAGDLPSALRDLELARSLGRLHVNISGCINACGHHHVGHIGILGVEKNGEEFYQITIGGRADEHAELGTLIGPAVPYDEVVDVVEDIAEAYLELRERPDELFIDTVQARRRRTLQGARLCHSLKAAASLRTDFVRIEDGAPVPPTGRVIVPATRFLADADEFAAREGAAGVIWPNDRNVAELAPHLDRLALVALVFPAFKDGRAYSQARLLRERYGYRGELRATGRCCATSSCFCCARASTLSMSSSRRMPPRLKRRRSATACSFSRPAMAA